MQYEGTDGFQNSATWPEKTEKKGCGIKFFL